MTYAFGFVLENGLIPKSLYYKWTDIGGCGSRNYLSIADIPESDLVVIGKSNFDNQPIFGLKSSEHEILTNIYNTHYNPYNEQKLSYEDLMQGYEQVKSYFAEPTYKISMVHGRQNSKEKETNMHRFKTGDTQILVGTTVIEVGVNVPNASVMVIESSEKFGLSQLHQLRGRVGRGSEQSYCILLSSVKIGREAKERLKIMCTIQKLRYTQYIKQLRVMMSIIPELLPKL